MLTIFIFILVWIFIIYLLHALFSSGMVFFVNVSILALTAGRITTDLKKTKMTGYYLASSLLTVFMFIAKDTKYVEPIFTFLSKAFILPMSIAMIFILFFAHALKLTYNYGKQLLENLKEKADSKLKK